MKQAIWGLVMAAGKTEQISSEIETAFLYLNDRPVLAYSLAGSVLFFVVTNFGAWLSDPAYPKTAAGLAAAYVAGIPFFQWTVLGTLAYAALLFGGFALLRQRLPALHARTV